MSQHPIAKDFSEEITTLDRVLQVLREEENVEVLTDTILNYLQSEFNYQLIWIGLYDRLDHRILGKGGITPDGETSFLKHKFILNPGDLLEQVVIQLRPVNVSDLQEETRAGEWRKLAINYNIQGTILFPIRYKDRCLGVVLLGSEVWGISPSSGEKAQLSIISGEFAATLHKIELDWQRQQAKRPDEPLLALLSALRKLTRTDQRLEAVVEATHQFIKPSRTNIYWYNGDRRYFWCRASNRQYAPRWNESQRAASGIAVQDIGAFYDALAADQIVSIGESHSSLRSDRAGKLMQQLRVRSLLAGPIVVDGEVLGFLAVQDDRPRIWQENEKNYLRGVAQLVGLTSPLSEMEEKIEEGRGDRDLIASITRAISNNSNWQRTLKSTADRLFKRLGVKYFLLLERSNSGEFKALYQNCPANALLKASFLAPLRKEELKLLQGSGELEVVAIENMQEDKRLKTWRKDLWNLGMRSLLACKTAAKNDRENDFGGSSEWGVLVLGGEAARTWNKSDRELVSIVAQQLGLILHQWQQQRFMQRQQQYSALFQSGLTMLQPNIGNYSLPKTTDDDSDTTLAQAFKASATAQNKSILDNLSLDRLQRNFVQFIAKIIAELAYEEEIPSPLVALVTWTPGARAGKIAASAAATPGLSVNHNISIPIDGDELIQRPLSTHGWLHLKASEIPAKSRSWLAILDKGELFEIALRTARDHQPTGILLIAAPKGGIKQRIQSQLHQSSDSVPLENLLTPLVRQLAWSRRYLLMEATLESQREELEWLNWYKQRRLEDLYRSVGWGVRQLSQLNHFNGDRSGEEKENLTSLRYQQLLRQIGNALTNTNSLLKQEKWRLHTNYEIVLVANLLRRLVERIDPAIKRRQLQLVAHREGNWSIRGDGIKLELVLYELLLCACFRSQPQGLLELRCKVLDDKWLELSIADNGAIDPQTIAELKMGFLPDLLAPSTLLTPPGKHLIICQRVIQQMGGRFSMDLLDEGRVVTRLILPLASSSAINN